MGEQRLLILVARDEATLTEVITGMLDAGIEPTTVVDSKGIGAIMHHDMPIFAGLGALLPQHTGDRMIFAITTSECIATLREFIDEMRPEHRPRGVVVPVESVVE